MAFYNILTIDHDTFNLNWNETGSFTYDEANTTWHSMLIEDDDTYLSDNSSGTPNHNDPTQTLVSYDGQPVDTYVEIGGSWTVYGSDGSVFTAWRMLQPSEVAGNIFFSEHLVDGVTYTLDDYNWAHAAPYADIATLTTVCFTKGTMIRTIKGEIAIEDLCEGDKVMTMDHGYQPIRWIGSTKRPAVGHLAPILIKKGALGNDRDLRVSPLHRMMVQGWQAELLFGETSVLATAKSLINDHTILKDEGGQVEYFHILFDQHEIIWSNGAPSESFHPGQQGWTALDQPTRDEVLELFPQFAEGDFASYGPTARPSLKFNEGALLGSVMQTA